MSGKDANENVVFIGAHVSVAQAAWLARMARNNGGMSRAAAVRRLIDNAMRREAREQVEAGISGN